MTTLRRPPAACPGGAPALHCVGDARLPKPPVTALPVAAPARPEVAAARRVVIKLGTRVLTHDDGRLALTQLYAIVEDDWRALGETRTSAAIPTGARVH